MVLSRGCMVLTGRGIQMFGAGGTRVIAPSVAGDSTTSVIVLGVIGSGYTRRVGMLILDVLAELPAVLFVRMVPVARMCAPIRRMKPLRMLAVVVTNPSRMRLRPLRMMSIEPGRVWLAPPS